MTSEVEVFIELLDAVRDSVLKKLAGLSEEEARRVLVPSDTNLAGIVQHLAFVEAKWFEQGVAGRKPSRGQRSMTVDRSKTLADLRADYRAACASSNDILRTIDNLERTVRVGSTEQTVRSIICSVLIETARHCGHADIIREQIDGQTGR